MFVDDLKGLIVSKLEVSSNGYYVRFSGKMDGEEKQVMFAAIGDCCSNSWIDSILNANVLYGREISRVSIVNENPEDVELRCKSNHYDECLQAYRYEFWTSAGYCALEFRNSSNGYYSGWLESVDELENEDDWVTVTDDWPQT